jgi:hypothetical protein
MVRDPAALLGDSSGASLAVVVLGLGAALFAVQRRAWRVTGAALAVVGVIAAGLASAGDRLLGGEPGGLTWRTGELVAVQWVPLGGSATQLQVSPSGKRFVVRRTGAYDDDGERASRFVVGTIEQSGSRRSVSALQALLVDDERLLLLASHGPDSLELRLERADPVDSTVFWRAAFPAVAAQRLTVDRARGRWTVSGQTMADEGTLVTTTGALSDGAFAVSSQPTDSLRGTTVFGFANGATLFTSFNVPSAGATSSAPSSLVPLLTAWGMGGMRWQLWRIGGDGRRQIGAVKGFLVCGDEEVDGTALCADQSRKGVQLWHVSSSGAMSEISRLPRSLDRVNVSPGGKVVLSAYTGKSVTLLDAATRVATRATLPLATGEFPGEFSWTREGAVALMFGSGGGGGGGVKLVVYRLAQ